MDLQSKRLTIDESFVRAWTTFKDNWAVIIFSTVLFAILTGILDLVLAIFKSMPGPFAMIGFLLASLLSVVFFMGYTGSIIELVRGQRISVIRFIFNGISRFWGIVLFFVFAIVGFLLLSLFAAPFSLVLGTIGQVSVVVICAVVFMVLWQFAPIAFFDKKLSIVKAARLSGHIVRGNWWRVLGLLLSIWMLACTLGLSVFFIGLFAQKVLSYAIIKSVIGVAFELLSSLVLSHYYLSALRELGVE